MPYQWIPPELFLEYAGVAVYHCYSDNDTLSEYWYTTDPTDNNFDFPKNHAVQFDIRDLPSLGLDVDDPHNQATIHRLIIEQAIKTGLLTGAPAVRFEPSPLRVIIEVVDGRAYVVEQPPGVEVKIIDRDQR